MKELFQAGGPLSPNAAAFDSSIYLRTPQGVNIARDAVNYVPQVIGSPRLSGKTTQVNTIVKYHERLAGSEHVLGIRCEIPKECDCVDEASLRSLLSTNLSATPDGSLRDILSSSPMLGRTRTVLAIINSEKIATSALHWLLSGFKAISDDHSLRLKLKIQLLIDGSFSVDTLTSGPDSDYPLPQTYPLEFTKSEQFTFLTSRLAGLKLKPTESALRFLWEHTAGDKYLTQVVGRYFCMAKNRRTGKNPIRLDAREVRMSLEEPGSWRELFAEATAAIGAVVLNLALQFDNPVGFIDQLMGDWQSLPPRLKALAYDGGIVRRTGPATVSLRAPMLAEGLRKSLKNASRSLAFLNSSFSISGVAEKDRPRALDAILEILQSSAREELMTVHVGHGKVIGSGVEVNAVALEGGVYTAIWSIPATGYSKDAEVWAMLWTVVSAGGRRTEQRIFAIKEAD